MAQRIVGFILFFVVLAVAYYITIWRLLPCLHKVLKIGMALSARMIKLIQHCIYKCSIIAIDGTS